MYNFRLFQSSLGDFFALECKAKALPVPTSRDTPNNSPIPTKFYTILYVGVYRCNLEFGIWNLEFGIWNLEFEICNLDFGFWILDFVIWILDFGFWIL
jgi:hypothetical protein